MVISYDKLWKLLIDKKMNKTDLKEQAGITYNILARMGKCQPVNLESLYKICKCLGCNLEDIIEFEMTKDGGTNNG
ncbi:helix-turn-helix transcriptional regulator [Clostridium botulinum]|nr:helix-turn-helix transcriptional regulator [Clostridium botulinum]